MPRKPHDYAPRDIALLSHVALHRIATPPCLSKVIFDSGNCGSVLKRLSEPSATNPHEAPLIQIIRKALPKNRSYVQLTTAGCRRLGVSQNLAAPLGKAALDQAIGIEYACAFSAQELHRVKRSEISPLLGSATPTENVPHVVSPSIAETASPALLRVYQATSDASTCLKHIEHLAIELAAKPVLAEWLHARDYGILVLCPTRGYFTAMRALIERSDLLHDWLILCELGPTADTLHEAIQGGKQ